MKYSMKSLLSLGVLVGFCILSVGCGQKLNKDTNGPGSVVNQVYLERDFQNVVHHDCSGNVTSQGVETVASPTHWVEIAPNDNSRTYDVHFSNKQTGSSPSLIVGEYNFQVDYSYGALNMHVVSGVNVIDYSFSHCTAWAPSPTGTGSCTSRLTDEQGTVTINVNYVEKNLTGSMDVSDCQPSPTPSPSPSPTPIHH